MGVANPVLGEGWPAAGAAVARCGGLVLGQDPSQCGEGAGVVTQDPGKVVKPAADAGTTGNLDSCS